MIIVNSTNKEIELGPLGRVFNKVPTYTPQPGDLIYGGMIGYIFKNGDTGYVEGETHGIVLALDVIGPFTLGGYPRSFWGITGTTITTSTAIGSGPTNTANIIAGIDDVYSDPNYLPSAAKCCDLYTGGSYTDWFLPSEDELYKSYLNIAPTICLDPNSRYWYWTSSENDTNTAKCTGIDFTNPSTIYKGNYSKMFNFGDPNFMCRPARYF